MTQGHIDREDAMLHALHPDDLEGNLRVGAKTVSDGKKPLTTKDPKEHFLKSQAQREIYHH